MRLSVFSISPAPLPNNSENGWPKSTQQAFWLIGDLNLSFTVPRPAFHHSTSVALK